MSNPLNPYTNLHKRNPKDVFRMTLMLPMEELELIRALYPGHGIVSGIVTTIMKGICDDLREQLNGEQPTYNPDLILATVRRHADIRTAGNSPRPDERAATPGLRPTPATDQLLGRVEDSAGAGNRKRKRTITVAKS